MAIEEEAPPVGAPEWFISFGDMMSLLLTFFVLLVSMSEMRKDDKFHAVVDSLREQFGDSLAAVTIKPGELRSADGRFVKLAKAARSEREQLLRSSEVSGPRTDFDRVEVVRPVSRVGFGAVVYFDDFNNVLSEPAKEQLKRLNDEIAGKPQKIEIRGHASLRPLTQDEQYADHWDLAYRRALATMDFMVNELAVDSHRIRVTSAGANEPAAPDSDSSGSTHYSARVEVIVLEEVVANLRGGGKATSVAFNNRPQAEANSPSPIPNSNPQTPNPSAPGAEKTKP